MPTITLQVGQCGNQLGSAFWSLLQQQQEHLVGSLLTREWFDSTAAGPCPRLISIDSEAKVARQIFGNCAPHQLQVLGHGGCGNNWACGYHFGVSSLLQQAKKQSAWSSNEDAVTPVEQVMEGVRKETERAAGVSDFLVIASSAGGTGSGTGSAVLEALTDDYPASTLAAVTVAPGHAGDSTVQSINTCLALRHLSLYAHAVVFMDNQALLNQLNASHCTVTRPAAAAAVPKPTARLRASFTNPKPAQSSSTIGSKQQTVLPALNPHAAKGSACLSDVNAVAAEALLGLLWPLNREDALASRSSIRQLAGTICADPVTKFVEVCSLSKPESAWTNGNGNSICSSSWPARLRLLASQLPRYDPYNPTQPVSTSAVFLMTRGMPGTAAYCPVPQHLAMPALQEYLQTGWSSPGCFAMGADPGAGAAGSWQERIAFDIRSSWPYFKGTRLDVHLGTSPIKLWSAGKPSGQPSMTAAVRRSSTGSLMLHAANRALELCDAGAYMHWYEKHGCAAEDIRNAAHDVLNLAVASCQ